MNRTPLSIPEIAIISGTRAALGAGAALILADKLSRQQRKAVGWTCFAIGAISTIPIVAQLVMSQHADSPSFRADSESPHSAGVSEWSSRPDLFERSRSSSRR